MSKKRDNISKTTANKAVPTRDSAFKSSVTSSPPLATGQVHPRPPKGKPNKK